MTPHGLRHAECARHRAEVIAVAAAAGTPTGPGPGNVDPAGARHLDRCAVCRNEAEQLALLSFAVQRAWRPAIDLEPSDDAWPRLRDRVRRRPVQLGRAASSIAGLALGAALTIGLLAPIGLGGSARLGGDPPTLLSETGSATDSPAVQRTPEERDEREWLLRQSRGRLVVQGAGAAAGPIHDVRGPVLPRREQMRYAEDERTSAVPAAVPSMTVL